ncbi:hypothetical protein ES703_38947 [subsurface metagenome]
MKNAVIDPGTCLGEYVEETVFFTIRRWLIPEVTITNRAPMADRFDVDAYLFLGKSLIGCIEQLDHESVGNATNVPALSVSADFPSVGPVWISFRGYAEQVSSQAMNIHSFR